jgi:Na+-translocating ferredoxin:NAD+ oxidoreductase RnfD subunit
MAAVAAFVGIALGKALFGGLGYNVMNPALVGRAFVQAAFPVAITTWTPAFAPGRFTELIPSTLTLPFMQPIPVDDWVAELNLDGWTGATPLAIQKFQHIETPIMDTFSGMIAGSAGETSALLILICGLWLAWQRMLDWRIPVSVMAGAVLVALPFWLLDPSLYPSPWIRALLGRADAGRLVHGQRHGGLAGDGDRRGDLRTLHRCADGRHPAVRRSGRGHHVRHPARQCARAADFELDPAARLRLQIE